MMKIVCIYIFAFSKSGRFLKRTNNQYMYQPCVISMMGEGGKQKRVCLVGSVLSFFWI